MRKTFFIKKHNSYPATRELGMNQDYFMPSHKIRISCAMCFLPVIKYVPGTQATVILFIIF